jgi:hypothetical protein
MASFREYYCKGHPRYPRMCTANLIAASPNLTLFVLQWAALRLYTCLKFAAIDVLGIIVICNSLFVQMFDVNFAVSAKTTTDVS